MAWPGNFPWREVPAYLAVQFAGAFAGVATASPDVECGSLPPTHVRHGAAQLWSEAVATSGFCLWIWGCSRFRPAPPLVRWSLHHRLLLVHGIDCFGKPAVTLAPFLQ